MLLSLKSISVNAKEMNTQLKEEGRKKYHARRRIHQS